jgi:hypothetical protein
LSLRSHGVDYCVLFARGHSFKIKWGRRLR